MIIQRRKFLKSGAYASAALFAPRFLHTLNNENVPLTATNKVVVVVQLSGGNDGLNTIIPVRNDLYFEARPKLSIKSTDALSLNDETGIHPALVYCKELYDEGALAILNNVGYPNPDRSHFRSLDIWHSASASDEYVATGWIGRYLDAACNGCDKPTQALEVDDMLSLALKGEKQKGIAVRDPRLLYNTSREQSVINLTQLHTIHYPEQPVDYLYKTLAETVSSAGYIFEQSKLRPSTADYPDTPIGKNLKTIASLILSDINTRVYYLSHGSFDTHVNQRATQQRLFAQLNDALRVFVQDLKRNNRFNDVLLFTFSEFGRRVAQNASGGTDHGAANNMMFLSGSLQQQGLINPLPDLADLPDGDLRCNVDFKQVYATILEKWLQANALQILGKDYTLLNFI